MTTYEPYVRPDDGTTDAHLRDPLRHARSLRRRVARFVAALPVLKWRLRTAPDDWERLSARADVTACRAAIAELSKFADLEEQRAQEG